MHFTPTPSHLHPHETQPCQGSSCTCRGCRGTHRHPAGPGAGATTLRSSNQEEAPGGVGGARADPPRHPRDKAVGGCRVLPSQLSHRDVPGQRET